jgi:hypothetical protein
MVTDLAQLGKETILAMTHSHHVIRCGEVNHTSIKLEKKRCNEECDMTCHKSTWEVAYIINLALGKYLYLLEHIRIWYGEFMGRSSHFYSNSKLMLKVAQGNSSIARIAFLCAVKYSRIQSVPQTQSLSISVFLNMCLTGALGRIIFCCRNSFTCFSGCVLSLVPSVK